MIPARRLIAFILLLPFVLGCGEDPEELLVSRWQESTWVYELVDRPPDDVKRVDGIRLGVFEDRTVTRHEAEYWQFRSDRTFKIQLKDGTERVGRWRLKGRGHILALRYASGEIEVYDVKELSRDELVLNFDMGMEIRGIARLGFSRVDSGSSSKTARNSGQSAALYRRTPPS